MGKEMQGGGNGQSKSQTGLDGSFEDGWSMRMRFLSGGAVKSSRVEDGSWVRLWRNGMAASGPRVVENSTACADEEVGHTGEK